MVRKKIYNQQNKKRLFSNKKSSSSSGGGGKKKPEVIDQAAASKAKREQSGGSSAAPLLLLAVSVPLGYGAIKLYKDPEFCTTARKKAPSIIKLVEPYIPMADKKGNNNNNISSSSNNNNGKSTLTNVEIFAEKEKTKAESSSATVDSTATTTGTATEEEKGSDETSSKDTVAETVQGDNSSSSTTEEENNNNNNNNGAKTDDTGTDAKKTEDEIVSEKITAEVIKAVETEAKIEELKEDAEMKREEVRKVRPSEEEIEKIKKDIKNVEEEAYQVQSAVREAAVKDVQDSHEILRKDLENILAEDLSTGDMETLRRRVVQLVMQVQEQNKREATKLVAVLNATESRTSEKIVESLKKQAAKYDELVQAKLLDQEIQLREKFSERLDETIDDYTKKIQYVSESLVDKYDDEKNAKIAEAREEIEAKLTVEFKRKLQEALEHSLQVQNERMEEVEEINSRLQMLDKVFHFNKEYLQKSHQIHLVCTALLSFHETLQGGSNTISDAAASLQVAAGDDPVIEAALSSIPKSAFKGIASMTELQSRFDVVKDQCRKSSFEPANAGIFGQAISSVANAIQEEVQNEAIFEGNTTEHKLARASYYLSKNDLANSVKEVETMDEKDGAYAADWLKQARTRLLVIQAVRAIGSHVTTLAATLS